MNMEKRIIAILEENTELDVKVGKTSKLLDDLGIDSLGFIHIVFDLERAFNIQIEDYEVNSQNFHSVPSLLYFIKSKLGITS